MGISGKPMIKGLIPAGGIVKPDTSHITNKYINIAYAGQSETKNGALTIF